MSATSQSSAADGAHPPSGFVDAAEFGFSPEATGLTNAEALQRALDQTGTIVVSRPGTYAIAKTVLIGSNTSLVFGNNVFLKKAPEAGAFTHVLLNRGALTKTYDKHISVEGLRLIVNGVDKAFDKIYGLRGQIAFFYVKDLRIARFRCEDLDRLQFAIHVCTFEDLIVDDVIIRGRKDGVHLGRGKRFTIRNGVFQTFDDAVALNAHDYSTGNPELGWIEDGVVENCHDLDQDETTGFFCRILAGAWTDWTPGMKVQQSDTVVSNGRLYRVQVEPDGTVYTSDTRPVHESGSEILDGIRWGVVQDDVTYTAGVRNVVFRDIFLHKARIGFSVHFDNDRYSRSYYPGAPVVQQEQLLFENIRVLHDGGNELFSIATPVDVLTVSNSVFRDNAIRFRGNEAMDDYLPTRINLIGCVFTNAGPTKLLINSVPGKHIRLQTTASTATSEQFRAVIEPGPGTVGVRSDLPGLPSQ